MPHLFRFPLFLTLALLGSCASDRPASDPMRLGVSPTLLPFTYEKGPHGMYNGGVRSILQDRSGAYWFGSHLEGVCRFDGTRMQCFTTADGLGDNQVRSIQEDSRGRVWFDLGVGIGCLSGETLVTQAERHYEPTVQRPIDAQDLWFKGNESVGFSEDEQQAGVYRCRDGVLTFLPFPLPVLKGTSSGYSVTGYAKGKGGRVWIATYNAVFGLDNTGFTMIDGDRMGLREGEGAPHVRCVFEDSAGRVWIGNNGVGVLVVDGDLDGEGTTSLTPARGTGEALLRMAAPLVASETSDGGRSLQRVFSIGEDRDHNIWIGTIGGGAWRFDGHTLTQFTAKDGLTTADVMAIYQDRSGDLWLGGNGVFRFDGARFERVH